MQNYRPRDKICIFGGRITHNIVVGITALIAALTYRFLAWRLHRQSSSWLHTQGETSGPCVPCRLDLSVNFAQIGLLPKDNPEQVPLAYKLFKRTDATSIQLAAGFKETFCRDVKIEFVGVW